METQTSRAPIAIPTRDQISEGNKAIFDDMTKKFGFVPNLYAVYAWSDQGFPDILALQNRKTTLSLKEKELVNLIVSEVNDCDYCRRGHSAIALNGKIFNEEQLMQVRSADIKFDDKLQALARFVKETAINRGHPTDEALQAFFDAGYTKANLIDTIINIGDKIISNYAHGVTKVASEFPEQPVVTLK